MKFSVALVFVILMKNTLPSHQQHLICKQVESVFSDNGHSELPQSSRDLRGSQGKRGPVGPKGSPGLPGPKGDPAVLDISLIMNMVDRKLAQERTQRIAQIKEVKDALDNIERQTGDSGEPTSSPVGGNVCRGEGGLYLDGKCFLVFIHRKRDVSLTEAKQICTNENAKAADVETMQQEKALLNFARTKLPDRGSNEIQLWLGMTYDHSARTLRKSTGQALNGDFIWDTGYPSDLERIQVIMEIDSGSTSPQGLWNSEPHYDQHGVICEK